MSVPPPNRKPFVLLALMTLATFGGPVAFGIVLRGGRSPHWPPDRTVEWVALAGITTLVLMLMIAAVSMAVANQREAARIKGARGRDES